MSARMNKQGRGRYFLPWAGPSFLARAVDDKVPIEAILVALDAAPPKVNVKIFLHGEEEGGGPGQAEVIKEYPDKLKSDLTVILDGPAHPNGKATIFYGARGYAGLTVTTPPGKACIAAITGTGCPTPMSAWPN
jgi:acetylornithine deacetylase/succinyl-diaminopimelate desuccinylase-like protein